MCGKDAVSLGNGVASACLVGAGETNFSGWSGNGGRVDGDLRDRVMLTGTADCSDAPRFRATPLPTKQHMETGCGCGSWEMSQECMTSALAWCLEIPGSIQPHLPSSLTVHPALTFPDVPWWTQPWELSPGTQLCLPWPQGWAPFSPAGGDLKVRCFQGNEVIRNSPEMLQATEGFICPCSSCERLHPAPTTRSPKASQTSPTPGANRCPGQSRAGLSRVRSRLGQHDSGQGQKLLE